MGHGARFDGQATFGWMRALGFDLDFRGMKRKLIVVGFGDLKANVSVGDNLGSRTTLIKGILAAAVFAKLDETSELLISGGSIASTASVGTGHHVRDGRVITVGALIKYYRDGELVRTETR